MPAAIRHTFGLCAVDCRAADALALRRSRVANQDADGTAYTVLLPGGSDGRNQRTGRLLAAELRLADGSAGTVYCNAVYKAAGGSLVIGDSHGESPRAGTPGARGVHVSGRVAPDAAPGYTPRDPRCLRVRRGQVSSAPVRHGKAGSHVIESEERCRVSRFSSGVKGRPATLALRRGVGGCASVGRSARRTPRRRLRTVSSILGFRAEPRRRHGAERFRDSYDEPSLLSEGEVYEIRVELGHLSHVVLAGHRLRLHVTSSDYRRTPGRRPRRASGWLRIGVRASE
jgi:hypothetical protein